MTTLSRRATPRQALLLRIIEGACRNAMHAHPEWNVPDKFARSVAKRAVGTLTDQWSAVLAASAVREVSVTCFAAETNDECHFSAAHQGSSVTLDTGLPIR